MTALLLESSGCGGVYPIRYVVSVNGAVITKWSLLAVQATTVAKPLAVSLVTPLTMRALRHPGRSMNAPQRTRAFFDVLPLTLSTNYEVLAAIQMNAVRGPKWVSALERALANPSIASLTRHPSDVDFAGLAANHLRTPKSAEQMTLSSDLFAAMTGHYVDDPVLLSGAQSPQSLVGARSLGL